LWSLLVCIQTAILYFWLFPPDECEVKDLPSEWEEFLCNGKQNKEERSLSNDGPIPEGRRNTTLTSIARSLRRAGMDADDIIVTLASINERRCQPNLPEEEVKSIARSIARYDPCSEDLPSDMIVRDEPIPLSNSFILHCHLGKQDELLLRRWRGEFYQYAASHYESVSDEILNSQIYCHLEQCWTYGSKGGRKRVIPTEKKVREVRRALPSRNLLINDKTDAPCWLDDRTDPNEIDYLKQELNYKLDKKQAEIDQQNNRLLSLEQRLLELERTDG